MSTVLAWVRFAFFWSRPKLVEKNFVSLMADKTTSTPSPAVAVSTPGVISTVRAAAAEARLDMSLGKIMLKFYTYLILFF